MLVFQFDERQRRSADDGRVPNLRDGAEVEAEVAGLNEHLAASPGASVFITL